MNKLEAYNSLKEEWRDCRKCHLHERRISSSIHKLVFGYGDVNADLMFIGEGPGRDEEMRGLPFIGRSGGTLQGFLQSFTKKGIDPKTREPGEVPIIPWDKTFVTNVVCCRSCDTFIEDPKKPERKTVKDKAPSKESMEACRERLLEQIYIVDPFLIVILGGVALKALAGKSAKLKDWIGELMTIKVPGKTKVGDEPRELSYSALVTYHPSYINRNLSMEDSSSESLAIKCLGHMEFAVKCVEEHRKLIGGE
jgi:DNA polymerase